MRVCVCVEGVSVKGAPTAPGALTAAPHQYQENPKPFSPNTRTPKRTHTHSAQRPHTQQRPPPPYLVALREAPREALIVAALHREHVDHRQRVHRLDVAQRVRGGGEGGLF